MKLTYILLIFGSSSAFPNEEAPGVAEKRMDSDSWSACSQFFLENCANDKVHETEEFKRLCGVNKVHFAVSNSMSVGGKTHMLVCILQTKQKRLAGKMQAVAKAAGDGKRSEAGILISQFRVPISSINVTKVPNRGFLGEVVALLPEDSDRHIAFRASFNRNGDPNCLQVKERQDKPDFTLWLNDGCM